jgi:uncharacterized membrane protein YheB (UPF0754 family)
MTWLDWAAPVAAGALIGFATNFIALKLFFRPLHEIRLFGLRIPFTPGLLPRRKREIARGFADAVSTAIRSENAVRKRIAEDDFQASLRKAIEEAVAEVLATPVGFLSLDREGSATSCLRSSLESLLESAVRSGELEPLLQAAIEKAVSGVFSFSAGDLISSFPSEEDTGTSIALAGSSSPQAREAAIRIIERLTDADAGSALHGMIDRWFDERIAGHGPISEAFPLDLPEMVDALFEIFYPTVVSGLGDFLQRPEIRKELEFRGRFFIRDVVGKLSFIQRLFVTAAQYDRTLDEKMPEIVDGLIESIVETASDGLNERRFREAFRDSIEEWTRTDFSSFMEGQPTNMRERIHEAVDSIMASLGKGSNRERAITTVGGFIDSLRDKRLGTILALAGITEKALVTFILPRVLGAMKDPSVPARFSVKILEFVSRYATINKTRNFAQVFGIGDERRREIIDFLCIKTNEMLSKRLPPVLGRIDVQTLVLEEVDRLDSAELERFILGDSAGQMKWISLFCAAIGGMLGLIQAMLSHL